MLAAEEAVGLSLGQAQVELRPRPASDLVPASHASRRERMRWLSSANKRMRDTYENNAEMRFLWQMAGQLHLPVERCLLTVDTGESERWRARRRRKVTLDRMRGLQEEIHRKEERLTRAIDVRETQRSDVPEEGGQGNAVDDEAAELSRMKLETELSVKELASHRSAMVTVARVFWEEVWEGEPLGRARRLEEFKSERASELRELVDSINRFIGRSEAKGRPLPPEKTQYVPDPVDLTLDDVILLLWESEGHIPASKEDLLRQISVEQPLPPGSRAGGAYKWMKTEHVNLVTEIDERRKRLRELARGNGAVPAESLVLLLEGELEDLRKALRTVQDEYARSGGVDEGREDELELAQRPENAAVVQMSAPVSSAIDMAYQRLVDRCEEEGSPAPGKQVMMTRDDLYVHFAALCALVYGANEVTVQNRYVASSRERIVGVQMMDEIDWLVRAVSRERTRFLSFF
jgi:hypothetical protein